MRGSAATALDAWIEVVGDRWVQPFASCRPPRVASDKVSAVSKLPLRTGHSDVRNDPVADDRPVGALLDRGEDAIQIDGTIFPTHHECDLVGLVPRLFEIGEATLQRDMKCLTTLFKGKMDAIGADDEAVVEINDAAAGEARGVSEAGAKLQVQNYRSVPAVPRRSQNFT